MKTTPPTEFQLAIRAAIKKKIKQLRAEGCTGMSMGNLLGVTPTPSPHLKGAPLGTNAQYYYAELFHAEAKNIASNFLVE